MFTADEMAKIQILCCVVSKSTKVQRKRWRGCRENRHRGAVSVENLLRVSFTFFFFLLCSKGKPINVLW